MRRLRLRDLTKAERAAVEKLPHSRTALARQVECACMIWQAKARRRLQSRRRYA